MSFVGLVGRKIGLDISWLIGNSTWLTAGRVSRMVAGIGITILFARFVDAEVFGQYQLLLSMVTIVAISTLPGFNGSLFRAIARGYDGTVRAVVSLSIKWGMVGVVVLIGSALYMYVVGSHAIAIGLLVSSILFPFAYVYNRWTVVLNAKELFRLGALYNILMSIVLVLGMAMAIFVFGNSAVFIFISFLLISGVFNAVYYFLSLRYLKNGRVEHHWKRSGYKLVFSNAFDVLYAHIDKVIIAYVLGVRAVAVYVIAVALGDAVKAVLVNGIIVYKSKIFRLDNDDIRHILRYHILLLGVVVSFIVAVLWFAVPLLVPLLFSDAYVESVQFSKVYLLIIPFSLMSTTLGEILIKIKREYSYFLSSVVSSVVNVVLYFILIPYMGIMGAVIASIVFHIIQCVLRYVMVLDGVSVSASK